MIKRHAHEHAHALSTKKTTLPQTLTSSSSPSSFLVHEHMFASNNSSSSAIPLAITAGDARKTKKGFLPMLPRRKSLDEKATKRPTTTTTTRAAFQSGTMVFPEQEDEAYPYLSRRRRVVAEEGGQFVRRGHAASYEHELHLRDEGVVEYAVRRRLETTMGARRDDVLDKVYARLLEGILGGSNTEDDSIRSREATAKEVREFALFGSDEAFETRRLKGGPLYTTLNNHRAKTFHVCETKSQSAFGKSIMKTFVSSDRSTGFIAFKMIEANSSRVFEVYEGSLAIEIDPLDYGSIVIVARGKAKLKGLLRKFAHKQVANVLVSKIRANLEKTRNAIDAPLAEKNTSENNKNNNAFA